MTGEKPQRIFGLDLLRTVAILIVVLEHSLGLISEHFIFLQRLVLPDGVDLFFVLSGFLIGGILIKSIERHEDFKPSQLFRFLQRRWLRTLPNYFLFLLLNLALIHFSLIKGQVNAYTPSYFLFLQNFAKPIDFMFWESWSLAVEEWFYLLFPLLLFLVFRFGRNVASKNKLLGVILLFVSLPLLYRFFALHTHPAQQDWDLYYRKLVLTRLDAIGFGLLAAYLKHFFTPYWISYKNLCFMFGSAGLILLTYHLNELLPHFAFARTVYFSISAVAVALLLPKLDSLMSEPIPMKPFEFLSRISYSMYLIHLPLYQMVDAYTNATSQGEALLRYSGYWALVIVLSFLVYRYFEKPILNLKKISEG